MSEMASGLKLRHFGGDYGPVWGGRKVQAPPIGEPECVIVRSCPPMAPKFRIPGLFWEREYLKYTVMGEQELLSSTCCVLLGCLQ